MLYCVLTEEIGFPRHYRWTVLKDRAIANKNLHGMIMPGSRAEELDSCRSVQPDRITSAYTTAHISKQTSAINWLSVEVKKETSLEQVGR